MTPLRHIAVAFLFVPTLMSCGAQDRYVAIDGDSIAHGRERIRLLYIDAPEMPDSPRDCQRRRCPAGDPRAAKFALQTALDSGHVRCEGDERDVYGRRLAECFVEAGENRVSVNDWMLSTGLVERYTWR